MTKIFGYLQLVLKIVIVLLVVSMITLVFLNVVLRYGFNSGLSFSVEISRVIFVWVVFLSIIIVTQKSAHLSVNLFEKYLSDKYSRLLDIFIRMIMIACCLIIALGSYQQVIINWNTLLPISKLPASIIYLAGLFSSMMMMMILLYQLFNNLSTSKSKSK